jgi:AraC-like DNA-binding protein
MGLIALDLGVRGAASGLFLMILLVLLKLRPSNAKIRLGAAMAAGRAAYAVATAPFVPKPWLMIALPVLVANPVIFWLWARATFDDDFLLRLWHGAVWLVMVGAGYLVFLGWPLWPSLAAIGVKCLSLAAVAFAMIAAAQTVQTWREDLIAGRRRLRIAVLAFNVLLIAIVAGSALTSKPIVNPDAPGSLGSALGLLTIAMLVSWSLFGTATTAPATLVTGAPVPGNAVPAPLVTGSDNDDARDTIAPALLRRLDHLMSTERIYRQEGLTIGLLAARLDLPEYRLRQVINEGLGYRNFNAFLNRYRIDDAKAALSDAGQREVPVLTIAIDAGFQSVGPFNRAFKVDTGMTPTEFRRDALLQLQAGGMDHGGAFKSGHSG